jgi:hypothetical protein
LFVFLLLQRYAGLPNALLFFKGFLTGVLQNHARKYNIPIDSLVFAFKVSDYEDGDPNIANDACNNTSNAGAVSAEGRGLYPDEDGVLIRGIFMEGARWDRQKKLLQDSFPMEMFSVCLLLFLVPFLKKVNPANPSTIIVCPPGAICTNTNTSTRSKSVCVAVVQNICKSWNSFNNGTLYQLCYFRQHTQ